MKLTASSVERAPCCGGDIDQGALDVLRHAFGVAADIDMRPLGEPTPQLRPDLAHAVLDVEFLIAVARPGERQSRQTARLAHRLEFVLVEEVVLAALVAEEQPGAAARAERLALLQEGAERRDAGARADHHDRRLRIVRQAEPVRLLHIGLHDFAGRDALAKEGRGDAEPVARADAIAHRVDGQRHAARGGFRRRRNRVEPRRQRIERLEHGLGIGPHAFKLAQRRQHVECRGVAVRVLAVGERARLGASFAAEHVGEQLEEIVGRGAERNVGDHRVAQGLAADVAARIGAERSDHVIGQRRMVLRKDAEAVADDIIETAGAEIEFDVPCGLGRADAVEAAARQELRFAGIVARGSGLPRPAPSRSPVRPRSRARRRPRRFPPQAA